MARVWRAQFPVSHASPARKCKSRKPNRNIKKRFVCSEWARKEDRTGWMTGLNSAYVYRAPWCGSSAGHERCWEWDRRPSIGSWVQPWWKRGRSQSGDARELSLPAGITMCISMRSGELRRERWLTWYENSGMKSFLYTDGYSFSRLFQARSRGTK